MRNLERNSITIPRSPIEFYPKSPLGRKVIVTPNPECPNSLEPGLSKQSKEEPRQPLNKLSCVDRKRIIADPRRPQSLTRAMKAWIAQTHAILDPFRTPGECWFHPSPPPPRTSPSGLRPNGNIKRSFAWTDDIGRHSLVLNFGICSKLIYLKMNKQQRDGWIQQQWHLSHLCGNWSCVNPRHTTVEAGALNSGRNACFAHRDGCIHVPRCMKELKAALGADGKLLPRGDEVEERVRRVYHWKEWHRWEEVRETIGKEAFSVEVEENAPWSQDEGDEDEEW